MAGSISDQTTVLSNLSINGTLSASSISLTNASLSVSTIAGSATFSGAVVTGSTLSAVGQVSTGNLSIGGGTVIVSSFASTAAVAAITCQATSSTSTLLTHNSITTGHFLVIHPPSGSGLSSGLVLNIQPGSAASTAVLTFSNASTVAAVTTAAAVYRIMGIKFSGV